MSSGKSSPIPRKKPQWSLAPDGHEEQNEQNEQKEQKKHYLYPGNIFASADPTAVTTVLGSCISVCLHDAGAMTGGINHYMLPLWNGEGLASPRYGNIAIPKLVEKLESLGCKRARLKAKVFGGGDVLKVTMGTMNIGERNIVIAKDMLRELQIPIVGIDVGGMTGRKLIFQTDTGKVLLKRLSKQIDDIKP